MAKHVIFKTGERALTSGVYGVILPGFDVSQHTVAITAGAPFPPFKGKAAGYELQREVSAKYTTATSASMLDEQTLTYSTLLRELAKR